MWSTKTYVTGGLGARWEGEAFGDEYELPPDRAYAETCAAIGGIQWAWRMLLATGEASYGDAIERMLYNGFLAGVLADRRREYFYVNPLQLREGAHPDTSRSPAHGTARLVRLRVLPAEHHAHAVEPRRLPRTTADDARPAAPVRRRRQSSPATSS